MISLQSRDSEMASRDGRGNREQDTGNRGRKRGVFGRALSLAALALAFIVGICFGGGSAWGQGIPKIADEPNTDKPILALDTGGHTNAVYKLLVSGYKDQLISVGLDKTIRLWDLGTGEPLRVLRPPVGPGAHGDRKSVV